MPQGFCIHLDNDSEGPGHNLDMDELSEEMPGHSATSLYVQRAPVITPPA